MESGAARRQYGRISSRIERSWGGVGVLDPHGSGAIYLEILLHAKVTSVMVNGGPDERDEK